MGISRCTEENGATRVIPGSHKWGPERAPKVSETVPAELEIGDALFFTGHVYHGGGANVTEYVFPSDRLGHTLEERVSDKSIAEMKRARISACS